jgi:hypothetical protein
MLKDSANKILLPTQCIADAVASRARAQGAKQFILNIFSDKSHRSVSGTKICAGWMAATKIVDVILA